MTALLPTTRHARRLVPVLGWILFVAAAVTLGLYAEAPELPGMREGARVAPRLPAPATDPRVLLYQLGVGSITWFFAAVALPFLALGARRVDVERRRGRLVAIVLGTVVLLVVVSGTIDYLATYPADIGRPPIRSFVPVALRQHVPPWSAVVGIVALIEGRRRARVSAIERERLRALAAERRLQALTGQLQPHFLFNTLQGISTLIHRDPNAADEMLTRLSDLLREVLRDRERTRVPLADELRYARTYLEIARIRFGERLRFSIDVPDELLQAMVPIFIMQPLIENSLRHGVGAQIRGGRIDIRARRHGTRLTIEVRDDGPGFNPSAPIERMGLGNTRERLQAAFSGDHRLLLESDGGAAVRIEIPLQVEAAHAGIPS
ncbi:MAG TPA: histidine kinase [Gemmatimonadaceae bacterium]